MVEEEGTAGSMQAPPLTRRRLAKQSLQWNITNSPDFCKYFPHLVEKARQQQHRRSTTSDANGSETEEAEAQVQVQGGNGKKKKIGVEWIVIFVVIAAMGLYRLLQDSML